MTKAPTLGGGGTLRDMLLRRERLSVPEAMEIALCVAEELSARRRDGKVCGPVSPELVCFDASEVPHWAECAEGEVESDPSDDVYGLGAMTYEMLAGIDPRHEASGVADVREYSPSLQLEIAELVMRMLSVDAAARPPSAAAVADSLRRLKRAWWKDRAEKPSVSAAEDADVFTAGDRFRGYVIERLLGKGGLGVVYLARHETLDAYFALKVLYPHVALKNPEYVRRFTREARLAARIRHPNVVSVYDAGLDEASGLHFMVMDYVTGSSLRLKLAFEGQLAIPEAVRIVRAVAQALAAGERFGLVHRDLKPENVMETREGAVKLIDFGVAKTTGTAMDSLCTMDNALFGTPGYVSPEQAVDSRDVDARSDIYSLGVILYEALAGRRPFVGATPGEMIAQLLSEVPAEDVRTFRPEVPPDLATLVARMVSKHREERPALPSDVVAALDELALAPPETGAATVEELPTPAEAEKSMADLLKLAGANATGMPTPAPRKRSWFGMLFGRK